MPPLATGGPPPTPFPGRPLLFGELLYDRFPDGSAILGGAPFNVAWHLAGLGGDPLLVGAVGRDPLGEEALAGLTGWGLDPAGIQRLDDSPTGTVEVELQGGHPTFTIPPHQAFDRIASPPALAAARQTVPFHLYHGTLALRDPTSRATFHALMTTHAPPRLVDVNLRSPWWRREEVWELIQGAQWVKLNQDELGLLGDPPPTGEPTTDAPLEPATLHHFRQRHGIQWLAVTRGARGALIAGPEQAHYQAHPPPVTVVDSVGAGDAFSAVLLLGLARGWPIPVLLERAVGFAARVCRIRGATTTDTGLYLPFREPWQSS